MKKRYRALWLSLVVTFACFYFTDQKALASQKSITVDAGTIKKTEAWVSSKMESISSLPTEYSHLPLWKIWNENGYYGFLYPVNIIYTPVYRITNRSQTLTASWTDSTYRLKTSDVPVPSTISVSYTDSSTGTKGSKSINKSGSLISLGTKQVKVYSTSYGRGENYDGVANTKLGWMSSNSSTYYGGAHKYSNSPRAPEDYYGPDAGTYGSKGWTLNSVAWDECCVRDAQDSAWHYKTKPYSYRWRSDSGNYNRYRKGVRLEYYRLVPGTKYKQDYKGTVSLPDIATEWKVSIEYSGVVSSVNLKASNLKFYQRGTNKEVSSLIAGVDYKAVLTYDNESPIWKQSNYEMNLFNGTTNLCQADQLSANPNSTNTAQCTFKLSNDGPVSLKAVIDSNNKIVEVNENDNHVTRSINVEIPRNLKAKIITVHDLSGERVNSVTAGNQYELRIQYVNDSKHPVGSHSFDLYENTNLLKRVSSGTIAAGGAKTYSHTFTAGTSAAVKYLLKVDSTDLIGEVDEEDNEAVAHANVNMNLYASLLFLRQYAQDCDTCVHKSFQDGAELQPGVYRIIGYYANHSDVRISSFRVRTMVNNSYVSRNISGLNARQQYNTGDDGHLFTLDKSEPVEIALEVDWDNRIDETNETDNVIVQKFNQRNLTAKSLKITNTDGTAVTDLKKGYRYKATLVVSNESSLNINAYKIGLYDEDVKLTTFSVPSHSVGQDKPFTYEFFALRDGLPRSFMMMVDEDNQILETDETDNIATLSKKVLYTNLIAESITITDTLGNPVGDLVKGQNYKATMVINNESNHNLGEYIVGFYEEGVRRAHINVASHASASTKTLNYNFVADTSGIRKFMVSADYTGVIEEHDETDNAARITKNVVAHNLRADQVRVTDINNNTVSSLLEGENYKVHFTYTNTGSTSVSSHQVLLRANHEDIHETQVTSLSAGQSKTVTVDYQATKSGNISFEGIADSSDHINEMNETDNSSSTSLDVYYVNLKASTIDITDINGNPVTSLSRGKQYTAKMTVLNESDIAVSNYTVSFYKNTTLEKDFSVTTHAKDGLLSFSHTFTADVSSTNLPFKLVVDRTNKIKEKDETDNSLIQEKDVYYTNLKAKQIVITDISGIPVAEMMQGEDYILKVTGTNESDWVMNKYNVGLIHDGEITALLPVENHAQGNDRIITHEFTAEKAGTHTFKFMLDYSEQIEEANENDNTLSLNMVVKPKNLVAKSFKITDLQNNEVSYFIRGKKYRATMVVHNETDIKVGPYHIGLYRDEDLISGFDVSSHLAKTDHTITHEFIADTSGTHTYYLKADDTEVVVESNEADNNRSLTKTTNFINLRADSLSITNLDGSTVSYLIRGKTYKATMVINNESDIDIANYKVGFYEQGVKQTTLDASSHDKGKDKTFTYNFVAANSGNPRAFKIKADDDNIIEESNETDNEVSLNKKVHFVNLKAKSLNITEIDGTPTTLLILGKTYRATMLVTNESDIDLGAYKVEFYEQGTKQTTFDVSSHAKGTDKTLTYDFVASTLGKPRNFKLAVDETNQIEESNETDNESLLDRNVQLPYNLKAKSINITNPDGTAVTHLVRGKTYKATMVVTNDSDLDVSAYKVGFYEQGSQRATLDVTAHTKGTDKTLTYNFVANTSGTPRTFKMKADDLNVIEESNESDNEVTQNKNVYYVNLKAESIVITDLSNNPVSHLVKGKEYKAVLVSTNESEINLGSYKVGFYEEGAKKATLNVSSHAKGTGNKLTYQFTAAVSGNRTFKMVTDDLNTIEESNENDNEMSLVKFVNTTPKVDLTYSPSKVYEGDTVQICANPTDADGQPLTVKVYMTKEGKTESLFHSVTNVVSGTKQCKSLIVEKGQYDIRVTVFDGFDQSEADTWFYAKELIIVGRVNHTDEWKSKHLTLGHTLNQFYSGEKFLLEAETSDYPINDIRSTLIAAQDNGSPISRKVDLTTVSPILHNGILFDEAFLNYPTTIRKGNHAFKFEVWYSNGIYKETTVGIEVIDDVFDLYRMHRSY